MNRRNFLQLLATVTAFRPQAAVTPPKSTFTVADMQASALKAQEVCLSIVEGRGIVMEMPDGSYDLMPLPPKIA